MPLFCSLHARFSLIVAEMHGDVLKFIGNEMPRSGFGGAVSSPFGVGAFRSSNGKNWAGCAHCGAQNAPAYNIRGHVWVCSCEHCNGLFHCAGNRDGQFRGACGRITTMWGPLVDSFQVQGWNTAAALRPAPLDEQPSPSLTSPPVAQLAAPRLTTLRLGYNGRR